MSKTDDDNDSYNIEYPLNNKLMFKKGSDIQIIKIKYPDFM